jgi:formamidopyrimidine-DNA glycosylase
VKIALLDQTLLAGLGNIQVSEALFRAGIHPARPANALTRDEVSRLLGAMRASISETLETLLASDARYLQEGAENHFMGARVSCAPAVVARRSCVRCRGRARPSFVRDVSARPGARLRPDRRRWPASAAGPRRWARCAGWRARR